MNFSENYILENEVVLLRPLTEEDVQHLKYFSENEPELWDFSLISASGNKQLQQYIHLALEQKNARTGYPWIVFDKGSQRYAGTTRFYDYLPQHKTLQLGYTWYGKEFQGTGLNKNCKYLLLTFAFEVLQMERVEFRADANNKRSIAAMKSIGCIEEGILRSNAISLHGRRDSIVLSILKEEWKASVKTNLKALLH